MYHKLDGLIEKLNEISVLSQEDREMIVNENVEYTHKVKHELIAKMEDFELIRGILLAVLFTITMIRDYVLDISIWIAIFLMYIIVYYIERSKKKIFQRKWDTLKKLFSTMSSFEHFRINDDGKEELIKKI